MSAARGNLSLDQIRTSDRLGAGSQAVTYSGASAPVAGHVPAFAADGSLIDGGAAEPANTILHGTGAPASTTGNNGDFYLDTNAQVLYGPKASGAWPTPGTALTAGAPTWGPSGVTWTWG